MIKYSFLSFILVGFFFGGALGVQAQVSMQGGGGEPVEISAGKTLEWLEQDKKYVAKGDVIAKQGKTSIHSQILTAHYADGEEKATKITRIVAEENVLIDNGEAMATGQKAIYDVVNGYAIITGHNLKLTMPDQVITARDKLEYWAKDGKAKASGNALVIRGQDKISAQNITAYFSKNKGDKKQGIEKLEASGTVKIVTPKETLYGDTVVFNSAQNTATLRGHVRIERGQNILEGARAEVHLGTKISKIFGGSTKNGETGRVRGVFFPGSDGFKSFSE